LKQNTYLSADEQRGKEINGFGVLFSGKLKEQPFEKQYFSPVISRNGQTINDQREKKKKRKIDKS